MTGIQCTTADNENGYDLIMQNGKLTIGETTPQNQAFLLVAHKGDFKETPLLGVGLPDIVNDNDFAAWKRRITEQFEQDGQRIDKLVLTAKGLTLEAQYK